MIKNLVIISAFSIMMLVSVAHTVEADVAVPESAWTGSMTFNSTHGGKFDGEDIQVRWNITQNTTSGIFTYSYRFTKNGDSVRPSHFILQVSDNFTTDNLLSANGGTELNLYEPGHPSNPDLSAPIYGIKFDYEADTYVFTTDRIPVYGDLYIKKGSGKNVKSRGTAWNDGLGIDPTEGLPNYSNWVPTPDSVTGGGGGSETPGAQIPGPAAVFGGMFLMVGSVLQRRRQNSDN